MGRRGPAPAPTKLKLVRGTRPDRVNPAEPEPAPNDPVMPDDLAPGAEAVWERVMRELGQARVIRAADTDILRLYCEAVARYEQASRLMASSGPLVKGARHGELVKSPLHQVVRDNADLVRILARELGLSPSARSALRASSEPANPLLEYLARGRRRA